MAKKKKFHVLEFDWNKQSKDTYDVLPYFRDSWNNKKFNFDKKNVVNKDDLKKWIQRTSQYKFWSRCEYEFLIAPWPMVSRKIIDKLQNIEINYDNDIKISNIITEPMYKIDIHEQIMMNIDIITDILMEEFKIKKSTKRKVDSKINEQDV